MSFAKSLPNHTEFLDGDLVLECEVSKERARVQWLKDGKQIRASKVIKIESSGVVRRLVIKNIDGKQCDSLKITCKIVGEKQPVETHCDVTVKQEGMRLILMNDIGYTNLFLYQKLPSLNHLMGLQSKMVKMLRLNVW